MSSDLTKLHNFTLADVLPCSYSGSCASGIYGERDIEGDLRRALVMLRTCIDHIESIEFTVTCGLASGIDMLRKILDETPQIQELIEYCKKDRAVSVFIIGHMLALAIKSIDEKYTNPSDISLVAYLHCIVNSKPELTKSAIAACKPAVNTFWPNRYISAYLS
jgi:hypothetical protein